MSQFWSPVVHTLTPYVPGEQPKLANLIKLNTNEHPYGPSPKVLAALHASISDALRLYPDPNSDALRNAVAAYHQVTPESIFVGNGSDEVLGHVFLGLLKHQAPLLFPDITYSFYPVYCQLYGIEFKTVPLNASMEIQTDDYRQDCGGIIFPNPNAPTGIGLSLTAVERLLQDHPNQVVAVDEAYVDFGGETAIPLVAKYPNLLVIHTLSKSRALAGLRVGFAIGNPALIEALNLVKNSFNSYPVDRLAMAGAAASYEDENYFQQMRQRVIDNRSKLIQDLTMLGFEVMPSQANFIFVRHSRFDAGQLTDGLRKKAIIVRHFRLPRIEQFMRITIGTEQQCDALVAVLTELTVG